MLSFEELLERHRTELTVSWKAFTSILSERQIPYPEAYSAKFVELREKIPEASAVDLISAIEEATKVLHDISNNIPVKLERVRQVFNKLRTVQENVDFLRREFLTDDLTGLWNRKALEIYFDHEVKPRIFVNDFTLVFIDLDNFKQVNDTCGHRTGDEVLKKFARWLKENIKQKDFLCRLHGDEFCMILPDTLPEQALRFVGNLAERFQQAQLRYRLIDDIRSFSLSFSAGITNIIAADSLSDALDRADGAMYAAKREKSRVKLVRV